MKSKTRTKVILKKISQGYNWIRRSESKQTVQPLHNIKVTLCDL